MPSINRTIRWYGLLNLPDDFERIADFTLAFDIVRLPTQPYTNVKYPTKKGLFGYVQRILDGRVVQTYPLEYENQIVDADTSTAAYLHSGQVCTIDDINASFINLGLWVRPGYVVIKTNPLKDWFSPGLGFDSYRIRLIEEICVGNFTFTYQMIPTCAISPFDPPPPPPERPPRNQNPPQPSSLPDSLLPPISPPYQGVDDDGYTYFPGFVPPPPPDEGGIVCQAYRVQISYRRRVTFVDGSVQDEVILQNEQGVYGPVNNLRVSIVGNVYEIVYDSRGQLTLGACAPLPIPTIWLSTQPSDPSITNFELLEVKFNYRIPITVAP